MTDTSLSYSTYQYILYGWIAIAVITFIILLKVTAPYGRHVTKGWGPEIHNRLGWILMEVPVLLVLLLFVLPTADLQTMVTWTMIGLLFSLYQPDFHFSLSHSYQREINAYPYRRFCNLF